MNPFSTEELRQLAEPHPFPCVSLYMPTPRLETRQGHIRLRNWLREAETRLLAAELRAPDVAAVLAPGQAVLNDGDFWRHVADGLALFMAPDGARHFALPRAFPERLVVGQRFHLKPLLPLLSEAGPYYVLTLSQKAVRLWRGSHAELAEVPAERLPHSLAEALPYEPLERAVRFRTAEAVGPGRWSSIAYGSTPEDPFKDELAQFCQRIDQGVREYLRAEAAPLVLAGVDYLLHIYRGVSQYPNLLPGEVAGNPDKLAPDELRRRAWAAVEPYFQRRPAEAVARFHALNGTPRAVTALRPILAAAQAGRVETLCLAQGQVQWGTYDPESGAVHEHDRQGPEDEDLLDRAALHVLLTGGAVFSLPPDDMPTAGPLAASLRY
jgi:hypothetical protein